jgi:integrase
LHDEIQKLKGTREAYTEEDLPWLFGAAMRDNDLHKLLILILYSGLRIGACYPLYYKDLMKVEGYPVYTYEVFSKGVKYNAIISEKAVAALNRLAAPNQQLLVQHDDGFSAPFDKRYRDMLNAAMRRGNLFEMRVGKSIFHSLRKTYSQKLLASELNPTDYTYKVLMGHIPKNSTATKYYITPTGKKVPLELIKRCAEAYCKTDLVKMGIGL